MCSSGRPPPSPSPTGGGNSSGSQYALCTLGVGLVALGMVMIVWSVMPPAIGDDSKPVSGGAAGKSRMSSVAIILVGGGMATLVLAFCLGMRSRRQLERWQGGTPDFQDHAGTVNQEGQDAIRTAQSAANYDVPNYEEVVGSGRYPVRQSSVQRSPSQLPSYEELLNSPEDGCSGVVDSSSGELSLESAQSAQMKQNHGRPGVQLLPLKVRRIKSEKLELAEPPVQVRSAPIEPLTPPPQYEEWPPELSDTINAGR